MTQLTDLPLREELRGKSAYGAPQLTVAYLSLIHISEPTRRS